MFRVGDKPLSAGDGHFEMMCSSFSQIHTDKLPATSKQNLCWDHSQVKKYCTILHISCKICKFLALLILQAKNRARFLHQLLCKIKILHISCTFISQHENLATFLHNLSYKKKSCKFFAPDILQNENLAGFLHQSLCKWKFCKFLIQTFVLKFLQNIASHTLQGFKHIATLVFWMNTTGFHKYTHTVWVNVNFVSGITYVCQNTDKHFSSSWSSVELFISVYSQILLNDLWEYAHWWLRL